MENKTPAETFLKFQSVLRDIDRSDRNPPITATSVTFTPSLRHAKRTVIGEFRSDLSITCMIDGNFGNVSAGILFSKVAYQGKTVVSLAQFVALRQIRAEINYLRVDLLDLRVIHACEWPLRNPTCPSSVINFKEYLM